MRIDLSCPACGSSGLAFNHAVSDACEVSCEDCGRTAGTFGDLKAMVVERLERGD